MAKSTFKVSGAVQVGSLSSAPANPERGMIYVDSGQNKVFIHNGSSFNEIQDEALLDSILGTLVGSPSNYTPTEATHSGHLQGIDSALGNKAESSVVSEIDQNVDDLITLSGVSENSTDLGTFTGSTISDNTVVKSALQELETEVELKADSSVVSEIDQNVDDLVTLSGVSENSTDLGTFSGSTISDNTVIKSALQELETAVESASGSDEKSDDVFRVIGNVDSSKKMAFEVDGITTATTRTVTMPDSDIDLGDISTNASNISTNSSNISANTSDIADIRTTQGTSDGDTNLGTFSGSTISDNGSVKAGMQELETAVEARIPSSEKGSNNGVATLDGGGKIPAAQLPNSVMDFKGTFDPATATFTDAGGNAGDVYLANAAGSYDAGSGSITYAIGDWAVHNGSVFEKSLNSNAVVSVNSQTGVVVLDSDDISEGSTNLYYTEARFDSSLSGKDTGDLSEGSNLYYTQARFDSAFTAKSTSDLSEGTNLYYTQARFDSAFSAKDSDDLSEGSTNLYHTDARAKSAAVVNSSAGSETDQAMSVSASKAYISSEISGSGAMQDLIDDTTPQLGGDLDVNGNAIEDDSSEIVIAGQNSIRRAKQASKSNYVEEEYLHSVSLLASQSSTVISSLNFAHASIDAVEIVYKLKDSAGALRMGTLRVVTDGTNVSLNDVGTELGDSSAIEFDAAVNGANVEISYDSGANTATMRCDIKRMLL